MWVIEVNDQNVLWIWMNGPTGIDQIGVFASGKLFIVKKIFFI